MVTPIDLKAAFAKLTMLEHRSPTSTPAEFEGAFGRVAPYRDGAIFTAKQRPNWDPVIVHVSDRAMLDQVAIVPPQAERLIAAIRRSDGLVIASPGHFDVGAPTMRATRSRSLEFRSAAAPGTWRSGRINIRPA